MIERVRFHDIHPVVVDPEIGGVGHGGRPTTQPAQKSVQSLRRLCLALLQSRADNRRQVSNILGDQKIVFHEPFDGMLASSLAVAELFGDGSLNVETEPLLGAAG